MLTETSVSQFRYGQSRVVYRLKIGDYCQRGCNRGPTRPCMMHMVTEAPPTICFCPAAQPQNRRLLGHEKRRASLRQRLRRLWSSLSVTKNSSCAHIPSSLVLFPPPTAGRLRHSENRLHSEIDGGNRMPASSKVSVRRSWTRGVASSLTSSSFLLLLAVVQFEDIQSSVFSFVAESEGVPPAVSTVPRISPFAI